MSIDPGPIIIAALGGLEVAAALHWRDMVCWCGQSQSWPFGRPRGATCPEDHERR